MGLNAWVYYSFFIVIALVGVLSFGMRYNYSIIDEYNGVKYARKKGVYFLTVIMFGYIVFWSAIRNGIADTTQYILSYEHQDVTMSLIDAWKTQIESDEKAPLFYVFRLIIKKLGFDYHGFLAIVSIISGICVVYGVGKYSDDVVLSCYIFVCSYLFYWMFNGIRQFLAAAIFFACARLIVEKKIFKFLLLVIVLYFIHKTSIILIPIYFISRFKTWSWQIWMCIIVVVTLVILFPNQVNNWLDTSFTDYGYAEATIDDNGVNFWRVIVSLVTPILAFIYRYRIGEYNSHFINMMVNMSLITAGIYAVGVVTSGIFVGRLPLYTELFTIILLPFILKRIVPNNIRPLLYVACIVGYFLHFYLQSGSLYYTTDVFDSLNLKGV